MTVYRVYVLDSAGHSMRPPLIVECADFDEAVTRARQLLDGQAIEIWDYP
jgi:hypothetical protein